MDEREWMNDPALEEIDKSKLAFLEKLVIKSSFHDAKRNAAFPAVFIKTKQGKQHFL